MIGFAAAAAVFLLGCLGAFLLACFETWDRLARRFLVARPAPRRPRKKPPARRKVPARR